MPNKFDSQKLAQDIITLKLNSFLTYARQYIQKTATKLQCTVNFEVEGVSESSSGDVLIDFVLTAGSEAVSHQFELTQDMPVDYDSLFQLVKVSFDANNKLATNKPLRKMFARLIATYVSLDIDWLKHLEDTDFTLVLTKQPEQEPQETGDDNDQ